MFFLVMLIVGFVISTGGFLYCIKSMIGFEFERFAVGMGVMALGGLVSGIGFMLGGYSILMELIAR